MSIYFYLPKLLCPRCNPKGCWRWWSSVSLEAANFQTRTSRLRNLTKDTHLRLEKPISLVSITHNAVISIATTEDGIVHGVSGFSLSATMGRKVQQQAKSSAGSAGPRGDPNTIPQAQHCFGTYFKNVKQWVLSHGLRCTPYTCKAVITFVFKVLCNGRLRYILWYTCAYPW